MCQNNGTCTVDPSGLVKCKCPSGFIGTACEIDTSICETKNCSNKGICVTALGGDYLCICNRMLLGNYYIKYFEFNNLIILNKAGYGGKDCQVKDLCDENLCQNDGVCQTVDTDSYKCICPSQFVGQNCEYSEYSLKLS